MTREEAIKRLKEARSTIQPYRYVDEAIDYAVTTLEQEAKWIPISEYGYPNPVDEYKYFLTVDNKGEITIQEFLLSIEKEPQPYFTGMRNIIAWMPLPEPYKADMRG